MAYIVYLPVFDFTGANYSKVTPVLPANTGVAGYDTGSGGIAWTPDQYAKYPDAIHIDQAAVNTTINELSDVLDFERGAATLSDLVPWYRAALTNYAQAKRPGQRWPCIYCSYDNRSQVVNEFIAAGVTSGPRLWLADYSLTIKDMLDILNQPAGPFPVVGVQAVNTTLWDQSLFDWAWFTTRSAVKVPPVYGTVQWVSGGILKGRDVVSGNEGRSWA